MYKIKKTIRIIAFICLIFLASIGVGLSGGIPLPISRTRKKSEEKIELMEKEGEESDDEKG